MMPLACLQLTKQSKVTALMQRPGQLGQPLASSHAPGWPCAPALARLKENHEEGLAVQPPMKALAG